MKQQITAKPGQKFSLFTVLIIVFTAAFVIFFLFPFYWQVSTSIKTPEKILQIPPQVVPYPAFFERYGSLFTKTKFPMNVRNSLIVSSCTMVIVVFFATLASYSIGRLKVPGSNTILIAVLVVSMLPAVSIVGPLYVMFRNLKLINSIQSLLIAYTAFFLPFSMWFLSSFFQTVPADLEEAAMIDGCNRMQALFKVVIPLSAPAIFTIALLIFIFSWNEFLYAFTFTSTAQARTYPVGLIMLQGEHHIPWGDITAASTVVSVPIVTLSLIAQKRIISGLTAGAIKG